MPASQQSSRAADRSSYLSRDTIAALSTSVGGAISVVRVSGPGAFEVLGAIAPGLRESELEPRRLTRARLLDETARPLDDALVARFVAPRSFTGEDCVELHLHGGAFTAIRVLETLGRLGARQALPGEFSFRAVRAGKMSLPQAEALADLIAAANESAVELALAKLDGAQNRLLSALAEDLRALATLGEAGIDFSDQDLDELGLPALRARASAILARIAELEASYSRGSRIQDGIRVAFVGLPNAGKSSFFNALLGEDRSIVSEIAGTTRDVVREKFTLRGDRTSVTLRLEDTAGLRASHDPVERMGVERSRRAASEADLIVLVVDGAAVDRQLPQLEAEWAGLGRPSDRTLGIVTKGDLPGARPAAAQGWMRERGILHSAVTSAATGEGVSEAARAMARFCERWVTHDAGEVVLTRLEHHRAAQDAAGHLARAISAEEIDLFAADVRHSLRALSPLIGETPPDDILGRIFSKFCIGK